MCALKVTDLFLGEKNFIDFVDKNLGQERDRLKNDELETDNVCHHLAGGILDYPPMISHDFADITAAIDVYYLAFTKEMSNKIPKPYAFGVFKKEPEKAGRLGKIPFRGDELTVKQFINAMLTACPKLRNHLMDCVDEATSTGRLENMFIIISNVVMVRNYLWMLLEILEADNKAKLKVEHKEFCDLTEALSEQMLQIFGNLLTTFILQDEQSQCFSSHQSYYEGDRASPVIPMWVYFIKNMRRDMWLKMPPQLAQKIFAILINDSLAILAARYSQIQPTEATTPQYVVDILNILTSIEEFLFYISPDLAGVCGQVDPSVSKILFSIHIKCHSLAAALLIVGCPLEVLYKNFRRGLSSCSLLESRPRSLTLLTEPPWMSVISLLSPKFYPSHMEYVDWDLLYNLKLLCAQPCIKWPLVYKVLTMNDCKIACFILSLFPKMSAPVTHFLLEGHGFLRCNQASCLDEICHSLPKTLPNHVVASCTCYVIATALSWDIFPTIFRPLLTLIDDWSVMDKTQIWISSNRPVWFQSLVDILLPVLKTCVQSLVLIISENAKNPEGATQTDTSAGASDKPESFPSTSVPPPSTRRGSVSAALNVGMEKEEELLTQWVIELLNSVTEVLSIIPRGFFVVCEEMDDLVPRKFIPVRGNVPLHFLVTGLYMLLNLGSSIISSIIEEEKPPPKPPSSAQKKKDHGAKSSNTQKPRKVKEADKGESAEVHSLSNRLEPCLFSVAERLCYLDNPIFDQVVHRMISQIESMMKHTKSNQDKITANSDVITDFALECDISHLKADLLMENIEGQLSLRVIYWFILSHASVLEDMIIGKANRDHHPRIKSGKLHAPLKPKDSSTLSSSRPQSRYASDVPKLTTKIKTIWPSVNLIHDFHYVNKYRTFDEILWDPNNLDWVQTIRQCKLGLHKGVIAKLLERRWEFKQSTEEELLTANDEKSLQLLKMISDITALVIQ